jgi:hypothetical protein
MSQPARSAPEPGIGVPPGGTQGASRPREISLASGIAIGIGTALVLGAVALGFYAVLPAYVKESAAGLVFIALLVGQLVILWKVLGIAGMRSVGPRLLAFVVGLLSQQLVGGLLLAAAMLPPGGG